MKELLKKLIQAEPTGDKGELAAAQVLAEYLSGHGIDCRIDRWDGSRANFIAQISSNGERDALLFAAHLDVVPPGEAEWKLPPFEAAEAGGRIYGRGAADMKGPLASLAGAMVEIVKEGTKLKGDLLLTFVDGEESGRAEIGIWSLIGKGYKTDFAIFCEPTNFENIYNKSKGEIYFDIKVKGESTHICNRYKTIWPQKSKKEQIGVNAIDKMVRIINALTELERSWGLDYYDPDLDPGTTTVTVSMIRGGESFSAQAGECEMTIASMFDPSLTVNDVKDQLMGTIDYVASHDHWLKDHRPEVKLPFPAKVPLKVPRDSEAIKTLVSAFEKIAGKAPTVRPSPFVGDVNYLFEKGVNGVNWGPGDLNMGIHGANEYVPVEQVLQATKAYAMAAADWCGVA